MPFKLSLSHLNVMRVIMAFSRDLYSQKILSLQPGRSESCAGVGERVGERLEKMILALKGGGEPEGDIL